MLQTEASIKGLVACLLQEDKPVYFASKALTDAQRGYVATDFLYASHFILETDQKLLEAILSKNVNQATPRLQQMLIRTFADHFTVRYTPGIERYNHASKSAHTQDYQPVKCKK